MTHHYKLLICLVFTLLVVPVVRADAGDKELYINQMDDMLNEGKHIFRENVGQWSSNINYRCVSSTSSISFRDGSIAFGLRKPYEVDVIQQNLNGDQEDFRSHYLVWELDFVGANLTSPLGLEEVQSKINYFGNGNPNSQNIGTYERIRYQEIYDNIDFDFYNNENGGLKYDVILHPGAHIEEVQLKYKGVDDVEISSNGELVVHTAWGSFSEAAPYSYQIIDGVQKEVKVVYVLTEGILHYRIEGDYDPNYDLVIDPIYVDWSTYFYGTGKSKVYTWAYTYVEDLDMDADFNVYIAGRTSDYFPTNYGAYDTSINGYFDAFICKMNKDGDSLIYFSYIGGSSWEFTSALALSDNNEAVVAGLTWSTDFPVTSNAYDKSGASTSNYKSFITKFSADGTKLLFSTYLGGTGWFNSVKALELNKDGHVYLVGATNSSDFPTTNGCFQSKYGGGSGASFWYERDAFFTILNSDGSKLNYSTYIGGAGNETALNLALNPDEEIYIVGHSSSSNFPVTLGSRQFFNYAARGTKDGFILKLNKDGKSLIYSHLMGGGGDDAFEGIYVNKYDEPYIAGYSNSGDFPTKNAYQPKSKGGYDQVIVKMISSGTNVKYSTYLGGSGDDYYYDGYWYYSFPNIRIAANIREEAIVCGLSKSTDYPTTTDALQRTNKSTTGSSSWWRTTSTIAKLNIYGDKLLYGSYWGGSDFEYPGAVKLKRISCYTSILYGGMTRSEDYPTTEGVYRDSANKTQTWNWSGFVTRFRDTLYTDEIELSFEDTIVECDKVYVILDAQNQGADIRWSHGPDDRFVILEDTGTYWVTATYGCDTTSDTITVNLEYFPKVPVLGDDSIFCDVYSPQLLDAKNDTIPASYRWQNGDTTQTFNAITPGKYWVNIITPNCGIKTDTVKYTMRYTPDVQLISDSVACDSVRILLDPGYIHDEIKYAWNTLDSTQTITVTDTGLYQVKMYGHCGVDSAITRITKLYTPSVKLPDDSVFCDDVDIRFKVGSADNEEEYLWSSWDKTVYYGISDTFHLKSNFDIAIEIKNKCGIASDSLDVGAIGTPVFGQFDTIYECDDVDELLQVSPTNSSFSFDWNDGSSSDQLQVNSEGLYRVSIANKCGTDSIRWRIILKKTPTVDLPNDSSYCNSIKLILNADINDDEAQYSWEDGSANPRRDVSDEGLYRVVITNRCGQVEDSVRYVIITSPFVELGDEKVYCGNILPTDFSVGTADNEESYLWSTGSVSDKETINQEGKFWVQISNKCRTVSDTSSIRVSDYPIVDLGPDTILCGNFDLTLDAGNSGMSYLWEPTGENSQSIKATEQTVYRVIVTNPDGCSSSDDFEIGSDCVSFIDIPNSFSPNGDNLNDIFKPQLVNFEDYEFIIANRWGEILFRTTDVNQGWDGTYNGTEVQEGAYIYHMRFITTENGEYETFNGVIHLIR